MLTSTRVSVCAVLQSCCYSCYPGCLPGPQGLARRQALMGALRREDAAVKESKRLEAELEGMRGLVKVRCLDGQAGRVGGLGGWVGGWVDQQWAFPTCLHLPDLLPAWAASGDESVCS